MACSVILKISHGYSVKGNGDPLVEMAQMAMDNLSETTTPGRFLVDLLPFCKFSVSLRFIVVTRPVLLVRRFPEWFPRCGFLRDARRWRRMLCEAADKPHMFVLEHLACVFRIFAACILISS